jgi:hypothetical protein
MNYLAHGHRYLDRPYFVAGTALPDWLSVVNRRVRVRSKHADPLAYSGGSIQREIAAGVVRHHADDDWFHRTRAFAELSLEFAVLLRDELPADDGLRPSFLGHILVELLLDDVLAAREPKLLDQYYGCLEKIEPTHVVGFVEVATGKDVPTLRDWIPRFLEVRFLYDYAEDAKLLYRLNQIMQRVALPPIPLRMLALLPDMRVAVELRAGDLLSPSKADDTGAK